jgi:hypothetical protein
MKRASRQMKVDIEKKHSLLRVIFRVHIRLCVRFRIRFRVWFRIRLRIRLRVGFRVWIRIRLSVRFGVRRLWSEMLKKDADIFLTFVGTFLKRFRQFETRSMLFAANASAKIASWRDIFLLICQRVFFDV